MIRWRERRVVLTGAALILVCSAILFLNPWRQAVTDRPPLPDTLPERLSDAEFWTLVETFSEPDGFFRSDNLLSNETGLQDVIPRLKERTRPGGAYLGVGPEQNFTYILATQPKISFIVDIRRLNLLEHLLYKALFELSQDRADFLARLFSRTRPAGLDDKTTVAKLFQAYSKVKPDKAVFEANLGAILEHLRNTRQFTLSPEDEAQIRYVHGAFYQSGPDLTYSFRGSYYQGALGMPTYRQLMEDTDAAGYNWSFLAEEDRFRRIQEIQRRNLVIPLVGDFAGPRTLRAVGNYLKQRNATLSVFYTSNVEMYLFQQGDDAWRRFYDNVATIPADSASSFIRFAVSRRTVVDLSSGVFRRRSQMWSPVEELITAVRSGKIEDYRAVIEMSN